MTPFFSKMDTDREEAAAGRMGGGGGGGCLLGGWCCGGGGVAVGVVAGTQAIVRMKVGQQGEGRVSAAGWLQPFCTAQCSTAQRSTTAKVLTRDVDKVCSEVVARVVLIQHHLCRQGRQ